MFFVTTFSGAVKEGNTRSVVLVGPYICIPTLFKNKHKTQNTEHRTQNTGPAVHSAVNNGGGPNKHISSLIMTKEIMTITMIVIILVIMVIMIMISMNMIMIS